MKSTIVLIAVILCSIINFSCSNKKTAEDFLNEYEGADSEILSSVEFSNEILAARESMVNNDDTQGVILIDSILLSSTTSVGSMQKKPTFPFNRQFNDSSYTLRRCAAIDNAPANARRLRANSLRLPVADIVIPVVYHIIQNEKGEGNIREEDIFEQHSLLNKAFSSSFVRFVIAKINNETNDDWYYGVNIGNSYERAMHDAISEDVETNLNVYFVKGTDYLGYANFPWDYRNDFDGVVIKNATLPGGKEPYYNEGKTLVHEVGHYLGLWHTFHNGCNVGDGIDDTPAQGLPTEGCPQNKDTCSEDYGYDLINNFMDYTDDNCMDSFTEGQISRINWAVRSYRKGFLASL